VGGKKSHCIAVGFNFLKIVIRLNSFIKPSCISPELTKIKGEVELKNAWSIGFFCFLYQNYKANLYQNFLKKALLKPRNYSLKNFPDERIADSIPMRIQPIEDPRQTN
jgi:hypothetical protein